MQIAILENGVKMRFISATKNFVVFVRAHVGNDLGMVSAEYAMGTVAACGFAGGLFKLLTGAAAQDVLWSIIKRAMELFLPW